MARGGFAERWTKHRRKQRKAAVAIDKRLLTVLGDGRPTDVGSRLLAESPSAFRRSLRAAAGIVIDRKIRVFQHRVMGGSSSAEADKIG
jgi:hypothetical protein